MKIVRVTVEVLQVPANPDSLMPGAAAAAHWHVLARVFTDEGVQGIGFIVINRLTLVRPLALATEELGQLLIGMHLMEIEAARARMDRASAYAGPGGMVNMAIAPLDIALWDAAGKSVGQPLYRLLGGYRDRVRAYASDGMWPSLPVDALAKSAQRHASMGLKLVKMRVGEQASPEGEVARVRAVQDAVGPEVKIMVDAAERWTEPQAMAAGRALQEAGIVWFEDPIPYESMDGLARLAQALDIPVAAGELLYGLEPFQRAFDAQAVDVAIMDLARMGGITPWMKVAAMAQARNIPVAGHVVPEVHVHLLAAVPNGDRVEYLPRSKPIFKNHLTLEDGHILAPQAPGIGLELDEAACERFRIG